MADRINVRCAGQLFDADGPCGWKSYRVTVTRHNTHRGLPPRPIDVTAKPCPRCGGQVELIDRKGADDG